MRSYVLTTVLEQNVLEKNIFLKEYLVKINTGSICIICIQEEKGKNYIDDPSQITLCLLKNKPSLNTNTSKLVEDTKAIELTIIKELGKLTP